MTSAEYLLEALNCKISFTTPEGHYEGVLTRVFVPSRMITVSKILFLPSEKKLGSLNFMFHEISNVKILNRPTIPCENVNETPLIYNRSHIDDLFNLDGDSEAESICKANEILKEEEFDLKLLPCFSKCLSNDSQIIDSLNDKFSLAIKHISSEDLIGVSLEGPKVARNGILSWLCISTPSCTYLFDIALSEKSFQNGLKFILENPKIKKIFHDCRLASDCLFHMYNVCLVNVFDTQVADSFVMMQESKNCSIVKQVNSLDSCLSYYLQLPEEYLYSPLVFDLDKKSIHYYGLRPLSIDLRGAMIKNVIYLRLLKREIETALMTPLRRAIDVYLNVIQNATDHELMVAPPILGELPPEMLLEGIQIVRYQEHEFIPPVVSSGPPCRKLVNPLKDFVQNCKKYQTGQENKCLPSDDSSVSHQNISNEIYENSSQSVSDFSEDKFIIHKKNTVNTLGFNKYIGNHDPFPSSEFVCKKDSFETEKSKILPKVKKDAFIESQHGLGDLSLKLDQSNDDEKNRAKSFNDPSIKIDNFGNKNHIADNTCTTANKISLNTKSPEKLDIIENTIEKSYEIQKSFSLESVCKVSKPVGNCLLRNFNEMPYEDFESTKSQSTITSKLFSHSAEEEKMNAQQYCNADWEAFCNEIRKECIAHQSDSDKNDRKSKLRFVPAGMALT